MAVRTTKRARRQPAHSRKAPGRLSLYQAKRNFAATREPEGRTEKTGPAKKAVVRRYVIQKHDATRLHYDLRLEMDGVYRSWAVPKGLPVKAGERNLAVEVEDHPLEYGSFEGTIPEGNYGAGTVMLWDRGNYTVGGGTPEENYREGKIHFALAGQKCVGEWTLVRMHARDDEKKTNWLVIKNSGAAHRPPMTGAERDKSVVSGRALEEIARGAKPRKPASRRGVPAAPQARPAAKKKARSRAGHGAGEPATFVPPMKALSVDRIPAGKWRLEIKLDGYRAIAVKNGDAIELWSRNHKSLAYPEVIEALKGITCANAVIDGEIVALDPAGRTRFQLLQGRDRGVERPPIVYYVFDLLHFDGRTLLKVPIEERQKTLEVLVGKKPGVIRFSPVFEMEPEGLLEAVRRQGLEGIIAKSPGSLYESGQRSGAWLKCKVFGEQEFIIAGFTPPRNSRTHFGAILVGYHDGEKLRYAGKVGSGFDRAQLEYLHGEFMKRRIATCPFDDLPMPRKPRFGLGMTAAAMREVTWLKPALVTQIRFSEWTRDGLLRQPVFAGLRRDKAPREVVREAGPVTHET